jgi:hypothetical protein
MTLIFQQFDEVSLMAAQIIAPGKRGWVSSSPQSENETALLAHRAPRGRKLGMLESLGKCANIAHMDTGRGLLKNRGWGTFLAVMCASFWV